MSLIIQSSVHYEVALEHMKIKLFITSLPNLIQDLGGNPFTHNEKILIMRCRESLVNLQTVGFLD